MNIHGSTRGRPRSDTLGGWVIACATHLSQIVSGNTLRGWVVAYASHPSRIIPGNTLGGWVSVNTILESDRVLVLDAGKVIEFDTPQTLLANKQSSFYSLAAEAGLA